MELSLWLRELGPALRTNAAGVAREIVAAFGAMAGTTAGFAVKKPSCGHGDRGWYPQRNENCRKSATENYGWHPAEFSQYRPQEQAKSRSCTRFNHDYNTTTPTSQPSIFVIYAKVVFGRNGLIFNFSQRQRPAKHSSPNI